MMKKFKFVAGLLSLAMTTACMASCGGGNGGTSEKEQNAEGKTVVKILCEAKGYGDDYAKKLAEVYNAKQSTVEIKVERSVTSVVHQSRLDAGAKSCDVDVFFTLQQNVFRNQVQVDKNHWADLSDLYDTPAEGFVESNGTTTIEDLLDPTYVQYFTFTDGKQYAIPYTSGAVGLLYNKTLWDRTNANLAKNGKAELVLPKTTDEMFTLFDRIKTDDVKGASENASYAFSYSGTDSYMHFMFNSLWPQYLGEEASLNFLEGKDENGVYTADIYKSDARLYAYDVCREMIMQKNGYVSSNDIKNGYNLEQVNFLKGSAFFSINGDWLEKEASSEIKPGESEVVMLRTPVMSAIVKNSAISADFTGSDAENDAKLSAIVSFIDENYLDGNGTPSDADATTLGVARSTLDFIYHARRVRHALVDFVAVVPEFSAELEEAKDFLRFMYSKEGMDIVLQNTNGCAAPMQIDYSQMSYYATATNFSKARLDLISKALAYGNAKNFPMQFMGNIELSVAGVQMKDLFGGTSVATAEDAMLSEYGKYAGIWNSTMEMSGVSN